MNEVKVNKSNKSITFINNGISFSQFGVADEILDLVTNLQECYCNRTDCSGRIKDSKKYDSLQQRIDKAIEYIPTIRRTPSYEMNIALDNLEEILQGSDEND